MQREMDSIIMNDTWKVIRDTGQRTVKCRWVFARKSDGTYKARIVAKGFSQRPGFDFHETYAPVAKIQTFRTLLALVVLHKLELHAMDVITAFLNGKLKEEIFMELPDGYKIPTMIAKLQRSLYGLKQLPRQWYAELNTFLLSLEYTRSLADEAFYYKKDCWVLVYVDDLFIAGRLQEITKLKKTMGERFRMKDLGEMSSFLGMQVIHDKNTQQIFLNQSNYFKRILEDFNMGTCYATPTPFIQGLQLEPLPLDSDGQPTGILDHDRYRTLIGSLLYGSTHTRPDISFALGVLSRYLNAPGKAHWSAANHLLRYIKGTIQYGLVYNGTAPRVCYFHADADFAFQIAHRKSTTGYASMLAGAAIIWNST